MTFEYDVEKREYYFLLDGERVYIGKTIDVNKVEKIIQENKIKKLEETVDSLSVAILSTEGVI